ncbi:HEPN domain-containing protein [Neorhizobium sp. NCHU2750]|uniref:HEPN domain-containing protein n=1 Tax=Neorhizobium sp. NCHU2750 TaxID=1825976 RepID=UPI000EB666C1|nr:nucleotidyltransferase [Neorhizobium sp. NCHU2750]
MKQAIHASYWSTKPMGLETCLTALPRNGRLDGKEWILEGKDDHLDEALGHLPIRKRRELGRVLKIIFAEFDAAQQTKLSEKKRSGRILKVILFGSYARGDWVEDRKSGYRSDYDILVVVNVKTVGEDNELWHHVSERILRELTITKTLQTPTNVIVHTLHDVNDQLARGRPFFVDVVRDGRMLYEEAGHPFGKLSLLNDKETSSVANAHFENWFTSASERFEMAQEAINRGYNKNGAFDLHQTVEKLYHCALLVLTSYSPKSHRLKSLRSFAEGVSPLLVEAWPRDSKLSRRAFERLDRAYVEARYSPHYSVSGDELVWLIGRITVLLQLVESICKEKISTLNERGDL